MHKETKKGERKENRKKCMKGKKVYMWLLDLCKRRPWRYNHMGRK